MLGNLLPLHNPLRIAEEIAMADCLSRGRVLAGFAREYGVFDVKIRRFGREVLPRLQAHEVRRVPARTALR